MTVDPTQLTLYAITDRPGEGLDERVEAALRGGATTIQLRLKGATAREVFAAAREVLPRCRWHGAPLIINDRLDIALAVGADGVHLGPDDLPVVEARRLAPDGFIVGGSAGTVEAAQALERAGADYLGVGAIFDARPSKSNASAPRGLEALAEVCAGVRIPVVAIGGVTRETAPRCVQAGAAGVAVIRAVFGSDDPLRITEAARSLRGALMS
ncbi:MAG: thiamine phosphate synthase [Myxococcales bacterium]|nr:thiamine phosphate synthase [Myxococcales bacterium]